MIRNYIKIAWRNIVKNKAHSLINIGGLSVGLACSLLILLWVQDEYRVDGFHTNGDQLYQVYERNIQEHQKDATYITQGLLADELKKRIPEIQFASGLEQNHPRTFQAGDKTLKMDGTYAGEDFFRMFSYPLLQGTIATALNNAYGIAISRKMAESFFGSDKNAIGKTIRFENKDNLVVTAVFENLPANSSMQFDFLKSWKAFMAENPWASTWGSASPATYIQLRKGANANAVSAKVKNFLALYRPPINDYHTDVLLQRFTDRYLHSNFKNGEIDGGRIEYVRIFSIVAAFILVIACINFMNLATARSIRRAREVGVRKVAGAARSGLIAQFLSEAILLTLIAAIFSVILTATVLPAFNAITSKQIVMPFGQLVFGLMLVGLVLFTGLISGSYPALFLSSLKPVKVLKGGLKFTPRSVAFRKGLVVFQFAVSIALITGMILIAKQLEFLKTKNLGYDRENLVYVPLEGDLIKKYDIFKDEASGIPGVQSISKMKESPTVIGHTKNDIDWVGKNPNEQVTFSDASVGYDFVKTLKLKLTDGRDFSKAFADSANYLVNESAAAKMGFKNAIGQYISMGGIKGKIVGVLKDFHFNSMHQAIEPLVIRFADDQKWGTILLRIQAGKTSSVLPQLETLCKSLNPDFTFSYTFSDQEYTKLYNSEQIVSRLCDYFTGISIFILCTGLLGLAMFTAEQRVKELGIRKVLGATTGSLFTMLSAEFLILVIIALLIATPIAWYATDKWLQGFAYHIAIQPWIFALGGGLIILITMATISFHALKAAMVNPVKSLKSE